MIFKNLAILLFATLLILILKPAKIWPLICSRYPTHIYKPKSPVDDHFTLSISGNPQTYVLGQSYNVSLTAFGGRRFIRFLIALENEDGNANQKEDLGSFLLTDTVETRYRPNCTNMVDSTNMGPKININFAWVAPQESDSGCILIRATVVQHRDIWFMDDGGLTKRICKEIVDETESQNSLSSMQPCCACDEARYEITFERLWSRNLHPKDFPTNVWLTHFSDMLGVAHSNDYRFWEYGELATPAMKVFAEHGSSRLLEREFHDNYKMGNIRTIIKARTPAFPNVNGRATASIRVDSKHHLISMVSKIEPSPDWLVGITGVNLCLPNCTWLLQNVINLYPTDIGTDAGPSYLSPDQPQVPPDVIKRLRSDYPNDSRYPFYNKDGSAMKPMAKLTISRRRLYYRLCENEESNDNDEALECNTHPWQDWSECSSKCGEGTQFRTRDYKEPEVAKKFNCYKQNYEERSCFESNCEHNNQNLDNSQEESNDECQLTSWGPWSPCSKTCGEGVMTSYRQYTNPMIKTKCQNMHYSPLSQQKKCFVRECDERQQTNNKLNYNSYDYSEENSQLNTTQTKDEWYDEEDYGRDYAPYEYSKLRSKPNNEVSEEKEKWKNEKGFEVANLYKGSPKSFLKPLQLNRNFNRCFKPLINSPCASSHSVKNFWFFNFCENTCMLYTTDECDFNENKFTSLELCERNCWEPINSVYKSVLRLKQTRNCLMVPNHHNKAYKNY
ncbi:spondin-1-like [Teleopsis dalmanni]|uniref:spondin-1-like n=1 Tax=Teleopsis dalmanni TaxID=139649 RepID=UPI0018CE48D0|nr:spondin-1-like [Teleopsis dalmanni]